MTGRRALVALCAVVLAVSGRRRVLVVLAPVGRLARADQRPTASDVLLSQDMSSFPAAGVSATLERRLFALCAAASRAGYPVKIALIA